MIHTATLRCDARGCAASTSAHGHCDVDAHTIVEINARNLGWQVGRDRRDPNAPEAKDYCPMHWPRKEAP